MVIGEILTDHYSYKKWGSKRSKPFRRQHYVINNFNVVQGRLAKAQFHFFQD